MSSPYSNLFLEVGQASANLVPNPSGALGAWGYKTTDTNVSLTAGPTVNGTTLQVTNYVAQKPTFYINAFAIPAGSTDVGVRMDITEVTASTSASVTFYYIDSAGNYIGNSTTTTTSLTTGTKYFKAGAVTAGAAYCYVGFQLTNAGGNLAAGAYLKWIKTMATTVLSGSVPATYTYVEPWTWTNILNPSSAINTGRAAWDIGTLNATVRDATLDPSVGTLLQPGRPVRLRNGQTSLFYGSIDDVQVTYSRDPRLITEIDLSAQDNMRVLAGQKAPNGYANITDLWATLTSQTIPWQINGAGNQPGGTPAVTSVNDSATIVDQIGLTRDNAGGYAWFDAAGVLQVWDQLALTSRSTIPNGSFETPAGWSYNANATTVTGRTGNAQRFAKVAGSPDLTVSSQWGQGVPVVGGSVYTFSIWTNAVNTARSVKLGVAEWNGGTFIKTTYNTPTTNVVGAWTQHTYTVQLTSATTNAFVTVVFAIGSGGSTEAHILDDAALTPATVQLTDVQPSTKPIPANALAYAANVTAGYDTNDIVNQVNITQLALATDGSTTSTVSTYADGPSIAASGVHSRAVTLQGSVSPSAYAASLLAAMKTPVRKPSSVAVPVTAANVARVCAVDVYDLAYFEFGTLIANTYRVQSVNHSITPEKWIATYTFVPRANVPVPRAMPKATTNNGSTGTTIPGTVTASSFKVVGNPGWQTLAAAGFTYAGTGAFVDFASPFGPCYVRKNLDGTVEFKGITMSNINVTNPAVLQAPAGWRPTQTILGVCMSSSSGTNVAVRWDLTAAGVLSLTAGIHVNDYISLNDVRYPTN